MTSLFHRASRMVSPSLVVDAVGFGSDRETPWRVSWSNLKRISASKIDLFTVDEIRMEFETRDGTIRTVSEECPGFQTLLNEMVLRFPSVASWQDKVLRPAFASQMTVLYEAAPDDDCSHATIVEVTYFCNGSSATMDSRHRRAASHLTAVR